MKYSEWTVKDEAIANQQGWTLMKKKGNPPYLQRLPTLGIFLDYGAAWIHVYNGFLAGDKVCKKALTILSQENRTEFLRIKEEGELANTKSKIE